MREVKNEIYQTLVTDSTLTDMLASNAPFNNPKGTATKANSILSAGKASTSTKTPFITIQGGPRVKVNPLGRVFDEFIYIRCYNDIKKSYVEIGNILERVEIILDDIDLSLDDENCVLVTLEEAGLEATDEELNLNFIETRYRIRLLNE